MQATRRQSLEQMPLGKAEQILSDDLIAALHNDPSRAVSTPGFAHSYTAAEVVTDHFAGESGEADLHEALLIIGHAARGADVQLRAAALVQRMATAHARFHADDLIEQEAA